MKYISHIGKPINSQTSNYICLHKTDPTRLAIKFDSIDDAVAYAKTHPDWEAFQEKITTEYYKIDEDDLTI